MIRRLQSPRTYPHAPGAIAMRNREIRRMRRLLGCRTWRPMGADGKLQPEQPL